MILRNPRPARRTSRPSSPAPPPSGPLVTLEKRRTTRKHGGNEKIDWIHVDRAMYDTCIDRRNYRDKASRKEST